MLIHTTGDRYDGEYREDKKNGRGVYTFANGARYDGEFRDDTYNGHGVYTWPDGRRYDGEWRNGERRNGKAMPGLRRLFGLSGGLGGSAGAKRIDEQPKPKKPFTFIPHSAAGMFNRCVALALAGLVSGFIAMVYDDKNAWHDAYDRYYNTVWHHPTLPYARFALFAGIIFSAIAIPSFLNIKPRSKSHLVAFIFALIFSCFSGWLLYVTFTVRDFTK